MTVTTSQGLQQKLALVQSIQDIQQVLASEGVELSEVDVVKGLIAEGALPRFSHLSATQQAQVAQVLVLAEGEPAIAAALATPADFATSLAPLLAHHGLILDDAVLAALTQPQELDDQQLEQIVGGGLTQ